MKKRSKKLSFVQTRVWVKQSPPLEQSPCGHWLLAWIQDHQGKRVALSIYLDCAGFEVHATTWGDARLPALLMWHGLARTGRDFDTIASALSHRWHVICPDQIGRGLSQWSQTPDQDYAFARYGEIATALADQLAPGRFLWLGTSMGGALGLRMAAGPLRDRIRALVVNDIGPSLPAPALARIRAYAGTPPDFATMGDFEAFVREAYRPFGAHSDAQWRHMAETTARRLPNGRITPHYDPAIVRQFDLHPDDYEFWDRYDTIATPLLVLHGLDSDLLLPETAAAMATRGPHARIAEISGCGHAPGLNTAAQIAVVESFLDQYAS